MSKGFILRSGAVLAAIIAAMAIMWWFSVPHSFEDCILRNVKSAQSDASARIIAQTCRSMFPIQAISEDGIRWDPPSPRK